MLNKELLDELIDLKDYEYFNNEYKYSAYQKIINVLKYYPKVITNTDQIKNLPGIGKKTIMKIDEFLKTGKISILEEYRKDKNLTDILNIVKIFSMGKKNAKKLLEGKLKLTKQQQLGIKYYNDIKQKIPRSEIDIFNNDLKNILKNTGIIFKICGSYRRKLDYSNDIDVVISYKHDINLIELMNIVIFILKQYELIILSHGKTKLMGLIKIKVIYRRIDIRVVNYINYWYTVFYLTGSKEFNKNIRSKLKSKGYKLNEYELKYKNKIFKANSEQDIFKNIKMKYVEPQDRL